MSKRQGVAGGTLDKARTRGGTGGPSAPTPHCGRGEGRGEAGRGGWAAWPKAAGAETLGKVGHLGSKASRAWLPLTCSPRGGAGGFWRGWAADRLREECGQSQQ